MRSGAEAVICASTGNTAASLAAYAARAGIGGAVIVPEGKIAAGKLAQALMHGARVVALRGNFDEALELVRELTQRHPIALVNSVNPFRLEGQKTAAFELLEELGPERLDALCIPVGNAGNITAYWKGFREVRRVRRACSASRPRAPRRSSTERPSRSPRPSPARSASATRRAGRRRWRAVTESRGAIEAVTDQEILDAYRLLAARRASSASPRAPRPWPGCSSTGRRARRAWSVCSPATG